MKSEQTKKKIYLSNSHHQEVYTRCITHYMAHYILYIGNRNIVKLSRYNSIRCIIYTYVCKIIYILLYSSCRL